MDKNICSDTQKKCSDTQKAFFLPAEAILANVKANFVPQK